MAFRLMSTACLLLATMSLPVSAQTTQDEKLAQVLSKLRACVRTNAPAAQQAGIKTIGEAAEFFQKKCFPPLVFSLGQNTDAGQNTSPGQITELDLKGVGAMPPGIYRRVVSEEWTAAIEEARPR